MLRVIMFVIWSLAFIAAIVSLYIVQDSATYTALAVGLLFLYMFVNSPSYRTGYRGLVFSLFYGFLCAQVIYTVVTGTINQNVNANPGFLLIGIGFVLAIVVTVLVTKDARLSLLRLFKWAWRSLRTKR